MTKTPSVVDPDHPPHLDSDFTDHLVTALKAAAGLASIPGAGSVVEILTAFLPQQKLDRVKDAVLILHDRISKLDAVFTDRNRCIRRKYSSSYSLVWGTRP